MNKSFVVAASGYFDPLHFGHVDYLERAKKLANGGKLIVIVNNEEQAKLKKGFEFMPVIERCKVVGALRCVDEIMVSIDGDGTVCESLKLLKPDIFAKGGDRFSDEIPEKQICDKYGIIIIDGLGAKVQSSSELINKSKQHK